MPAMPASHIGTGSRCGCYTLIQFPADMPGKAVKDDPNGWAHITYVGDPEEAKLGWDTVLPFSLLFGC